MSNDFNLAFATPFLRSLTESYKVAEDLRELILKSETDAHRHPNSPQQAHSGVFESTFDFLSWPDERVQHFKPVFYSYVAGFVKIVNDLSDDELSSLRFDNHCWFHVTRDGGYFQPHKHGMASWSAIYCVDPGDDDPADEHCAGHVVFGDPRAGASMYLDPANRHMRRDVSFDAIRLRPRATEVIIFPSYMTHWIEPYIGERPRITVAANFWFRREDP
jgi:uncharacterized protein (TIGR02466 family)